ncbi:hypothetical protein BJP40_19965 [Streptomyces sp. CC53]|uniref:hypothetical protein n=1 Tax=unclassified Streptomyces TaxID=2593676 RepID=UPI0008DC6C4C|nr:MULTISPECIES: hypothetical protein [unclassified Streptomyces]OII64617.1 hypothetical protein BJP40_19965 [Streptomyces sp. CC53]
MTPLDRARRLLDQPPPVLLPGQTALPVTARRPPPVCDVPRPDHAGRVRLYPAGWRCSTHAPWAVAGRPEPQPGPGWPATAWATPSPQGASRVHDARAIASGRRRSNPTAYRAAQAAVRRTSQQAADTAAAYQNGHL